jgi:hypothetical protein
MPEAEQALSRLLPLTRHSVGSIEVSGHSDATPIHGSVFASNWELSAARAAAAVRFLEASGIDRDRLAARGLADTQPISTNETKEGRADNRRIEIMIDEVDWNGMDRTLRETLEIEKQASDTQSSEKQAAEPGEVQAPLPDLEDIDPALLEQLLRDIEAGNG